MNTIFDAFVAAAKAAPRRPFVCCPESAPKQSRDISYEAMLQRVADLQALYVEAGYGHGHTVALLLGQTIDFLSHYLALNGLGCTIVPVNPDYQHDELA